MSVVKVKKEYQDSKLPIRATTHASGWDCFAHHFNQNEDDNKFTVIRPNSQCLIDTGISVEIEPGWEIQVRPRSGLALNKEISITNSPGTIDADYRGHVGVILRNNSNRDFLVQNGDKIAQLVVCPVNIDEWSEVIEINESDRGSGGFGSTGK